MYASLHKDSAMTQQETARNHWKTKPCTVLAEVVDVAEFSAHYAVSLHFFLRLSAESGGLLQKLVDSTENVLGSISLCHPALHSAGPE